MAKTKAMAGPAHQKSRSEIETGISRPGRSRARPAHQKSRSEIETPSTDETESGITMPAHQKSRSEIETYSFRSGFGLQNRRLTKNLARRLKLGFFRSNLEDGECRLTKNLARRLKPSGSPIVTTYARPAHQKSRSEIETGQTQIEIH